MPRLIMLNNQPSGWTSLATGAAEGLGQGLLQQEQQRRQLEARRQIMADQLAGQIQVHSLQNQATDARQNKQNQAVLERQKIANDLITQRNAVAYDRSRQDKLADESRKQDQSAADAAAEQGYYESSGLLPVERPMPDGVAGPGMRTPVLKTPASVHAAAGAYGQNLTRQATQADREIDNARQAQALEQTGLYQNRRLTQAEADAAERARHNRAIEGKTKAFTPSREAVQKAENAKNTAMQFERMAYAWNTNMDARNALKKQGYTIEGLTQQAQVWRMRAAAQLEAPEQGPQAVTADAGQQAMSFPREPQDETLDPVDAELARRGIK